MTTWSLAELLSLAQLSSAAYEADSAPAVNKIPGAAWVAQFGNKECQATVAKWAEHTTVIIRGTQVGGNGVFSLSELFDNVDGNPLTINGLTVSTGYFAPLADLWPQIEKVIGNGDVVITGHSMGGVRAHLAKILHPAAEVISFGAPNGALPATWDFVYGQATPTRVVHERDFAPSWLPIGSTHYSQPGPMIWLHDGKAEPAAHRPGFNVSLSDHDVDTGYVASLARLVV